MLIFRLDEQRYALPLGQVVELARAVNPVPLPQAPPIVEGVINVHGRVVPLFDVRSRFGLPPKPRGPQDHLVISLAGGRVVALRADRADELMTVPMSAVEHLDASPYVSGVARLDDGLVLIHDLESFLSEDESRDLMSALRAAQREIERER